MQTGAAVIIGDGDYANLQLQHSRGSAEYVIVVAPRARRAQFCDIRCTEGVARITRSNCNMNPNQTSKSQIPKVGRPSGCELSRTVVGRTSGCELSSLAGGRPSGCELTAEVVRPKLEGGLKSI